MGKLSRILLLCGISTLCLADTLTLKSGETVEGTYLGGTARQLRMEINGNIQTYDVAAVAGIQFHSGASANQSTYASPPPDARPDYSSNNGPAYPAPNQGLEIPAGTELTIRMIDNVDSETARLGDTFRASIDEPVMIDGQPVIQRGADVVAKLVEDQKSGKIQGRAVLKVALVSVKVGDRLVDISTDDVVQESGSRGAKSAKVIGGTAALGAIIGGIAGGGKGAAIGAGSGAAVGTGVQVLTKGQRVKIPSETRLTFRLSYAVRV